MNIETLIEAAIAPVLRACQHESGRFFTQFLLQLTADPRYTLEELLDDAIPDSMHILTDRIRSLLHHLPAEQRHQRMRMSSVIGINLAAEYARQLQNDEAPNIEFVIADAVASICGFLMASPIR